MFKTRITELLGIIQDIPSVKEVMMGLSMGRGNHQEAVLFLCGYSVKDYDAPCIAGHYRITIRVVIA